MRIMRGALAALFCGWVGATASLAAERAPAKAAPAEAAPVQPPADPGDPPYQSEEGGAGYLPGARFQRKLDGGPGFVCSATNALHDQQCTASCRAGETADCVDADGGGAPSCGCTKG